MRGKFIDKSRVSFGFIAFARLSFLFGLILVFLLISSREWGIDSTEKAGAAQWYDYSYSYRKGITIENNRDIALEDYTVEIADDVSPKSYWSIDEINEGVVADQTGNGYDMTAHGGTVIEGVYSQAVATNGTSEWIEYPKAVDFGADNTWAVSMWFKLSTLPSATDDTKLIEPLGAALSTHNALYIDNDNIIKAFNGTKIGTQVVTADTWYHVVGVKDGNAYTIYVNGEQKGTSANYNFSFGTINGYQAFSNSSNGVWGHGAIDEVRFFDEAITVD